MRGDTSVLFTFTLHYRCWPCEWTWSHRPLPAPCTVVTQTPLRGRPLPSGRKKAPGPLHPNTVVTQASVTNQVNEHVLGRVAQAGNGSRGFDAVSQGANKTNRPRLATRTHSVLFVFRYFSLLIDHLLALVEYQVRGKKSRG